MSWGFETGQEVGGSAAAVQQDGGKGEGLQIGILLAYVSNSGRTFLDRESYLSDDWMVDWKRMRETGVPEI